MLVVLGLLLAVMAGLVQVGTLVYAYERIGIDRSWLLALLGLSIVGSTVNLPVARLRSSVVLGPQVIRVYGIRYLVPAVRQRRVTVIAVNVGGALVPVLVVLGLLLAVMAGLVQVGTLVYAYERIGIDRSWLLALLGLSIVGSAVNLPVARLRSSVVLGPQVIRVYGIRYLVPAVRTLVGADLLNLPRIRKLGAPVASIGGAGTFDGIFLSGLLAVLIASI